MEWEIYQGKYWSFAENNDIKYLQKSRGTIVQEAITGEFNNPKPRCRLCLQWPDMDRGLQNISTEDESSLACKIRVCLGVLVSTKDSIQTICTNCRLTVNFIDEFRLLCRQTEEIYESVLIRCEDSESWKRYGKYVGELRKLIQEHKTKINGQLVKVEDVEGTADKHSISPEVVPIFQLKEEPKDGEEYLSDDPPMVIGMLESKIEIVENDLADMSDAAWTSSKAVLNGSPMDVEAEAEAALVDLVPENSKSLYESAYKKFEKWRKENNIQSIDDKCMLAYFSQAMVSQKPSTKWSRYSRLKTVINMKTGINIASFASLLPFLKRKAYGYSPKKSKILTKEQIFKFLKEANDNTYLAVKVVMIVGVCGACRREEIQKLSISDIEDMEDSIQISISNTNTKTVRQFVITAGNVPGVDLLQLFRRYVQKRPVNTPHSRFFVGYRNGKCMKQSIGINSFAQMPKQVAEFLKLPSPEEYTGHCFRRSSASLDLLDSGVDMCILEKHGDWKSSTTAEGFPSMAVTNDQSSSKTTPAVKTEEAIVGVSDSKPDCPMEEEPTTAATSAGLLSEKSKSLYEGAFNKFEKWRMENNIQSVDEKCMLAYFSQEMVSQKPSTKWSQYSMLKTTINMKMGINISDFALPFLKRKLDGYIPKKSKILTKEEIFRFLKDAGDNAYLAIKVALIVGVYGACRRGEILKLSLSDIEDMGDRIKVTIPNTTTKTIRQFVITAGNVPGVDLLQLFRRYAGMRPADTQHSRFFVGYRSGKCTKQAIGVNSLAQMPKVIAEFLMLPSPEEYTGHCFRRSAASLRGGWSVTI